MSEKTETYRFWCAYRCPTVPHRLFGANNFGKKILKFSFAFFIIYLRYLAFPHDACLLVYQLVRCLRKEKENETNETTHQKLCWLPPGGDMRFPPSGQ